MLVGTRRPIPAAAPAPRPAQDVRQDAALIGAAQPGAETPPAAMPNRPSFAAASNAGSAAVRRPGMRSMPQSAAAASGSGTGFGRTCPRAPHDSRSSVCAD